MRIFLAGTNAEIKHKDVLKTSPYLLESFYYVKDWQTELIHNCKDFLLDSGAFTFCGTGKFNSEQFEEYIEKYANYIKKNDIKHFFELDIDSIVGYEKVLEYRKKLETLTNRQCIPVWHMARGKEEFIRHCDEYPYVALGGYVAAIKQGDPRQRLYIKCYPWFINEAHKRGTQIHGLGFTNTTLLPQIHFDSVDSTRWNCARFGRIEYFDGKTIRPIDRRKDGKRLKGRSSNIDIIQITLTEWIKYQKYAETHL